MFYACVTRFDVMRNLEKNCKFLGSKQGLIGISRASIVRLEWSLFFIKALFSSKKFLNLTTAAFSLYWTISVQP